MQDIRGRHVRILCIKHTATQSLYIHAHCTDPHSLAAHSLRSQTVSKTPHISQIILDSYNEAAHHAVRQRRALVWLRSRPGHPLVRTHARAARPTCETCQSHKRVLQPEGQQLHGRTSEILLHKLLREDQWRADLLVRGDVCQSKCPLGLVSETGPTHPQRRALTLRHTRTVLQTHDHSLVCANKRLELFKVCL